MGIYFDAARVHVLNPHSNQFDAVQPTAVPDQAVADRTIDLRQPRPKGSNHEATSPGTT